MYLIFSDFLLEDDLQLGVDGFEEIVLHSRLIVLELV